jgi:hypothetical protein
MSHLTRERGTLPWHFLDEFLEREHQFLKRGGQFIVPLPEVRLVGAP